MLHAVIGDRGPGEGVVRHGPRHARRRSMACVMVEPRVRHCVRSAAPLMIEAQFVSPGKVHRNAVINQEGQGSAKAWNDQTIFTRSVEAREISFIDFLKGVGVYVQPWSARTARVPV